MISSNSMLQTNVREGYRIITLEVIELIEDLISYLRNAQIPKVFYKAAYSAKVKIEDLSNMLTLILSKTAQQQSLSVVSNRSTALITDKFSVALLTELAILNNANIALVDAVHYSVQKLEENYFEVIDALTMTLIKNDNDLLGTVNSYIKPPLKRCKTEAVDSRYVKVSRGRTKKDKDLEDSNTSSDVLRLCRRDRRLGKEAQLKKTRDEEELAKLDSLLDSDDYCLDSSLDINLKDNLEDEEATTAKDLLIDAYILYFKELLSDNSGIFANAIGIGKTRAITEVQNARVEGDAIEHNAVNNDDKLCPTKGERTFYCANSPLENIGRLTKEKVIEMQIDTTDAISKALAAANKLVALQSYIILEANMPAVHPKATKHCLALLAAQFVIVCSFRKVDKHMFRAYNTISVTAQRTIIRKGGSYIEKRAILLSDILEKEGLNELEASRRVIFNCFEMQAIASYSALATLKLGLREKFSNESVLVMQGGMTQDLDRPWIIVALIAFAEAIILIEATHVLAEMCVSIIYFNLDSELELKVLGKQDVKITF
ncbi:hypothetical protein HBI56_117810 [Parastagonospora nodorum]|nr:hypothetical protein HBI56_117810 [Parastagonospora nodorum]